MSRKNRRQSIKLRVPCWCGRFIEVGGIPTTKAHCERPECIQQAVQNRQELQQAEDAWRQAFRRA